MRLIDADALKFMDFETCDTGDWYQIIERVCGRNQIRRIVKDAPTVDAVPVVRCRDCKWFGDFGCAIRIVDDSDKPTENDFCSFAERRTE